jgi:hypothetical protein
MAGLLLDSDVKDDNGLVLADLPRRLRMDPLTRTRCTCRRGRWTPSSMAPIHLLLHHCVFLLNAGHVRNMLLPPGEVHLLLPLHAFLLKLVYFFPC